MDAHPSLRALKDEMGRLSEQFGSRATLPPKCFTAMQAKFLEYESRRLLKVAFPVLESFLNPVRIMQGGFIAAAFDNTFGPLSYLAAREACVTLDLHTQFIRTITLGDTLTVQATVVSRGPQTLYLAGEATNGRGKLVATCSANAVVVKATTPVG
ncbi:MAG: PaaI family thioesterase [Bacteroidota bacterium]